MSFQLFSKHKPALGLDISDDSFKIVEFELKKDGVAVKGFGNTPLPKGLINADAISDTVTFSHLVQQAMQRSQYGRLDTAHAVVSLPETKSFVRVIQIPQMSESEAESAVPFESENFIPLPIDQVYLDWQIIGRVQDKLNVLIIASPKDFVNAFLTVLEKCGLVPVALEVESQSCHRALIEPNSTETSLIVDMASSRTSLIMVEEGNLQFTSTIPVAGNAFTESIARALGVSSAKAEMIKQKIGIANTAEYPNIKTALLPVLANLSAEIKNILHFHEEHSEKKVEKIILAGGTAQLQNLAEYLTAEFADMPGLLIEPGNPWKNVKNAGNLAIDPGQALTYTTAIGLALRGTAWE